MDDKYFEIAKNTMEEWKWKNIIRQSWENYTKVTALK
jgi:hypothetical protein